LTYYANKEKTRHRYEIAGEGGDRKGREETTPIRVEIIFKSSHQKETTDACIFFQSIRFHSSVLDS